MGLVLNLCEFLAEHPTEFSRENIGRVCTFLLDKVKSERDNPRRERSWKYFSDLDDFRLYAALNKNWHGKGAYAVSIMRAKGGTAFYRALWRFVEKKEPDKDQRSLMAKQVFDYLKGFD